MEFLTEISKRLSASAPTFFKKIQKIGNWLWVTGIALIGVPATIEQVLPKFQFDLSLLGTISSYMVLAGVIITTLAKLPVSDIKDIK